MGDAKTGYVKIYRKSMDDEVFKNPYAWQLFSYCIMRARFKKTKKYDIGEFETTQEEMAIDLNVSRKSINKFLKILKVNKCVDYEIVGKKTIIRVENFSKYQ